MLEIATVLVADYRVSGDYASVTTTKSDIYRNSFEGIGFQVVRIKKSSNVQGNRHQIVNNAGIPVERSRIEVRDRRLLPDYATKRAGQQERHSYCTPGPGASFVVVRLTDNELRQRIAAGEQFWHGTLGKDYRPKGRKVVIT